jgi:hypothetical protein
MTNPTHIRIHVSEGSYGQYYIRRDLKWTPYNACVEYADYYEIAMYSCYMRIGKKTLEITSNFRDVDTYEKLDDRWAIVY